MSGWLLRHLQSALFAAGRMARAPVATAFTVLVIAIALTLPTALALGIQSVRFSTGEFANAVDVSVYFKRDVPLEKARQLAASVKPELPIVFTGLRPGEKLHEELVADSDSALPSSHPQILVSRLGPLAAADVLAAAQDLTLRARAGDDAGLRARLAAILPDFDPAPAAGG